VYDAALRCCRARFTAGEEAGEVSREVCGAVPWAFLKIIKIIVASSHIPTTLPGAHIFVGGICAPYLQLDCVPPRRTADSGQSISDVGFSRAMALKTRRLVAGSQSANGLSFVNIASTGGSST
jgi:hypothetical protein